MATCVYDNAEMQMYRTIQSNVNQQTIIRHIQDVLSAISKYFSWQDSLTAVLELYTLAYETVMALWFKKFFQWCSGQQKIANIDEKFWQTMLSCHDAFSDLNTNVVDLSEFLILFREQFFSLISEFREFSYKASPTFKFWEMFLRAGEVMLLNVRAERDGDWNTHLQSVSSMLPYFFIANKTNYARWTTAYLIDMLNLPEETYSAFMSGKFAVRQKPGVFNGIWSDMATKKTIIKDSKGSGGIVGLTTQKSALLRWTFTRHILAKYALEMRKRSGIALGSEENHENNRPTAMKRDEQEVNDLIEHVQNNMTDPFDIEE
ncbi:unnamed protein product [Mytilus coruscus]|uniref:Uncharacterized protein n=1 Tax=Mytilus coruscus TaxID=42192 RepID=A0A6J8D7I7_MYTCO|nr:unnamed protein product [Mytilus coruscus]